MNKEEILKEIMELPKIETNNPISAMNGINVDDLMSAIDRFNKIPDYNDLLKENKELKKQLDEYKGSHYCSFIDICKNTKIANYNQQKEFLDYLEDEIKRLKESDIYQPLQKMALATHEHTLQKYKSIIGDINEKK
jgi:hypothetical protein